MRKSTKLLNAQFAEAVKHFPKFNLPFELKDYNSKYNTALWTLMIDGEGNKHHQIKINWKFISDANDLMGTLCHELIHAMQCEQNRETDHGKFFAFWSAKFAKIGINTLSSDVCPKQYHAYCRHIARNGDLFHNVKIGG